MIMKCLGCQMRLRNAEREESQEPTDGERDGIVMGLFVSLLHSCAVLLPQICFVAVQFSHSFRCWKNTLL